MSVQTYASRLLAENPEYDITMSVAAFADMIRTAAADEREECAKLVDAAGDATEFKQLARQIRARPNNA